MNNFAKFVLAALLTIALAGCAEDAPETVELAPGLSYEVLEAADDGATLVAAPFVQFEAEARAGDELLFSSERDGAITMPMATLEAMAPGLAQAVRDSPVGERRRWRIAPELFTNPPSETAVVELVVTGGREPIPAPDDVEGPPADAIVTDSGLAYRRLATGPADGPLATTDDAVTVHYTGWRAEDGEMFDSSVIREQPATFLVTGVIAGWTEALQLMRPGDTFRVWIPGNLAYDNSTRPNAPKGMLVFDVELLEIRAKD